MKGIQISSLKKHLPLILSIASSLGVVATAVQAVKDTKKAEVKVNLMEGSDDYIAKSSEEFKKKKRKVEFSCYIPTIAFGAGTIALIFMSNHFGKKQYLALASAYTLLKEGYSEYRQEVVTRYGTEADGDIIKTIAAEKAKEINISADIFGMANTSLEAEGIHEEILTFYEPMSKRFFKSTISRVIQAEYHLNRNYALGYSVGLNDYYDFLGLENTIEGSELAWWHNYFDGGCEWIDFNHRRVEQDGLVFYVIDCPFPPGPYDPDND